MTKKKVRSYLKHVPLGEDGSKIFLTPLGEEYIFPKFEDRESVIFAKVMQGKSSYSKIREKTRFHKDPGVQFQFIFWRCLLLNKTCGDTYH